LRTLNVESRSTSAHSTDELDMEIAVIWRSHDAVSARRGEGQASKDTVRSRRLQTRNPIGSSIALTTDRLARH
jgi:hypothetical protein